VVNTAHHPARDAGSCRSARDGDGVYRTYFTNGRGVDRLRLDLNIFYLTSVGRQEEWEDSPDGWPRTEATSP